MPARFILKAAVAATLAAFGISMNAYSQNTPTASPNQSATTSDTAATHMAGSNDSARTVAGTKGSKAGANGSGLDKGSVKFLREAAAGDLAEVELGKLAQERAANAQVKEFGARMAKDHAKANDELKPIADAKNVALPSAPDKKTQREYDKLAKKSGGDFDKAYMKHMLDDHKKDVKEFQKEAQKGKDADLKNFASNTLPTLEEHLRLAQATYDEVRGKK